MHIILLIGLIRLLIATSKPFLCSSLYAISIFIFDLLIGHHFPAILISAFIGFVLASVYFYLLERFSGNQLLWWLIAAFGILIGLV